MLCIHICMYVYLAETGINRFKLSWKSAFTFHPLIKLYTAEKFVIIFLHARWKFSYWFHEYEKRKKKNKRDVTEIDLVLTWLLSKIEDSIYMRSGRGQMKVDDRNQIHVPFLFEPHMAIVTVRWRTRGVLKIWNTLDILFIKWTKKHGNYGFTVQSAYLWVSLNKDVQSTDNTDVTCLEEKKKLYAWEIVISSVCLPYQDGND